MRIRVAMLGLRAPWGTEGGVEAAVGELAPRLAARGCDLTVYCRTHYNTLGEGFHNGVRLVNLETIYSKHLEAIVHTARAAPIAARTADVVHIHATGPSLMSWLPRLAGRATVVTLHGLDWQRGKWGLAARTVLRAGARSAATFPHRVIAVGAHLRDHYIDRYGVTPALIPNGVSAIRPQPLELGGVAGLTPRNYMLFVGRLVPEKGLERLFDAYAASGTKVPLIIVGGATHMEAYHERLLLRAPSGVRMVGPRYGRARDALLSHARAFILPSTLEGFPLAALEAMASGLPVLLSDIPPHQELLGGCQRPAGWLVGDDRWPQALQEVSDAGWARLAAMGGAGQAHVAAHYSWDQIADKTLDVYREALHVAWKTRG